MQVKAGMGESLLDFYNRCEQASTLPALGLLFTERAALLGFPFVACGAHVNPQTPPDGAFLIHNYPTPWIERFAERRYFMLDPVYRGAERLRAPFCWDDPLFAAALSDRQRRILSEARSFRLAHGYTIPLFSDAYLPASCSVVSETGDLDPDALAQIKAMSVVLYFQAGRILQSVCASPLASPLTRRERQCLSLKADGALDREIAQRLGISVATVCRHFEQAKLRLGATSREHAVALAIRTRQIPGL